MQFFRQNESDVSAIVGWGVRVMILTSAEEVTQSKAAVRIAGLGGQVEIENEAFSALDTLILDDTGYGLLVIECDSFGGLAAGRNLVSMLHKGGVSLPVILVSSDCTEQEFPYEGNAPVVLRAPISAVSLRVGFEHAMRDRLVFQAA
ncbi:hypothetical protein [Pseudorhodobacter ferrugineus]|uniref:hypothetical protein n=1 Tax=Pseudorhodobacter ferrugineus TaxID=77008 RepID=UPI0003B39DB9|nr:hypothetical protein [Pseudorhodobacter ferrugineus]